jgi:hypothetical protein
MRDLLVSGASAQEIVLDKVPIEAVIARQKNVTLLKRGDLGHRLYKLNSNRDSSYVPVKRVAARRRFNPCRNLDMYFRDQIREVSRASYAEHRDHPHVGLMVQRAISQAVETFARSDWKANFVFCIACIAKSAGFWFDNLMQKLHKFV